MWQTSGILVSWSMPPYQTCKTESLHFSVRMGNLHNILGISVWVYHVTSFVIYKILHGHTAAIHSCPKHLILLRTSAAIMGGSFPVLLHLGNWYEEIVLPIGNCPQFRCHFTSKEGQGPYFWKYSKVRRGLPGSEQAKNLIRRCFRVLLSGFFFRGFHFP